MTITLTNTSQGRSAGITLFAIMRNSTGNFTAIGSIIDVNATIGGNAVIIGSTITAGNITGNSTLIVNATIHGALTVVIDSIIRDGATVNNATINNATVQGSLANVSNGAVVRDNAVVNNATVTNSATISNSTVGSNAIIEKTNVTNSTILGAIIKGIKRTPTVQNVNISWREVGNITVVDVNILNVNNNATLARTTDGYAVHRGINFTSIYQEVAINRLVINKSSDATIAPGQQVELNESNLNTSFNFNLIVNPNSATLLNVSRTGISPDGVGTDSSLGSRVGDFVHIAENTSSTGVSFAKIRMYYSTAPSSTEVSIYYYNSILGWTKEANLTSGSDSRGNYVEVTTNHTSTWVALAAPAAPAPPAPVSVPGGGGGGAGVISPEPFHNIEMFEIMEDSLVANVPTSYILTAQDIVISEVLITPAKNFGLTSIRVEMLKELSKIEGITPPIGIVYKYANIWAGAKELEGEEGIIDAFIGFKVETGWLAENNLEEDIIKLLRWDGSKWVTLDTTAKSRDEQFVYYEAKTPGFSPFAIVAIPLYLSAAD
ncbi:MAG: PGF-pre-PGF domain-containing protein, partial [Candidatus Methanoperedens sp.]|nr:PGF-pre-PGF domain-containing protein [Candidatus Methanoperedens sp.]